MYYRYPDDVATSDFIDPETNVTVSNLMYQWWTNYAGFDENGEQVFGEASEDTLTGACAPCAQTRPCFSALGCSSLDFETGTWAEPYDECAPAFPCLECFPDCEAPTDNQGPDIDVDTDEGMVDTNVEGNNEDDEETKSGNEGDENGIGSSGPKLTSGLATLSGVVIVVTMYL
jgi:hypothetical protein